MPAIERSGLLTTDLVVKPARATMATLWNGGHLTIGARISSACRFTLLEPPSQMAHALARQTPRDGT